MPAHPSSDHREELAPVRLPDGRELLASHAPYVMGILNLTPDSFSDGGRFSHREQAVARALEMLDEGAHLIDIGGESTRPGALPVSLDEELERVIPTIEALRARAPQAILSIDTMKAEVARQALDAGAHLINDVSAMDDPQMAEVVARSGAPIVLMHRRGTPQTMQQDTHYEDLLGEIRGYFLARMARAEQAGIARAQLILDPGIGFGKDAAQNLTLIRRLDHLAALGQMILLGPSRKRFIGEVLGVPVEERVMGTAASVACGVMLGAHIVRVHDVREMSQVVRMTRAILGAETI